MRCLLAGILLLPMLVASAEAEVLWRFRTFTTEDGLAHNVVRDVLEDRQGVLWFATMGGLTRYEPGRCRIEKVELGHPQRQEVMALAEGRDGSLWVATQGGGLGRLRAGGWTWFDRQQGLPSDEITSVLVDGDGQVWATPTAGGLARFDGRSWRIYTTRDGLSSGEIGRCAQLRDGSILCATYERPVLQRFQGGRWSQLAVDAPARRHFYVHALQETQNGELWLATKGAGVIQGQPQKSGYRWTLHDSSVGLAANRAGALRQGKDGSIWIATTAGVSRYLDGRWQTLTRRDGLGSNQIFAVTESRDGAIWFASLGGGVSRYAPSRWEQIGESSGLPSENVTGGLVLSGDGTIWAGTDEGLAVRSAGAPRWRPLRAEPGPPGQDHVNHLLRTRDGTIWIASREGLLRSRGEQVEVVEIPGLPHPQVNRLARDRGDGLWLATSSGVSALRAGRWQTFGIAEGLPSAQVNDLVADESGVIWAATDNGIAHLQGSRWVSSQRSASTSRLNRVNSLALDRSPALWASGLEGITRRQGQRWEPLPPTSWLPAGLYSRFVMTTGDGSLWIAVRGLGLRRLRDGIWTALSSRDGLAADTVSDVKLAADGHLLFATLGGGISRYRPDRDPPRTWVGDETGQPRGLPTRVVQGEDAVLSFGGVDVLKETAPESLLYSFRVDGGPWSAFGSDRRAVLRGLAPGPHLFEVRSMDQDMNIDPAPAQHRFQVVRPWWAERWLLGLLAATLGLGLFAAVRTVRAVVRERAAVRRERAAVQQEQATLGQRREFVRLASHELRKPLARLAHRAEMLAQPRALEEQGKRSEYALAIAEDSRTLARLVETLLEQARVQEGLRLELRPGDLRELVAAAVAELEGEPAVLRHQAATEALPIDHDAHLLPLIIRNLLDNALKYAGPAGPIEVRTERDGQLARLHVRDQGPGIPAAERERIFEPFFRGRGRQSEVSGFGLGLAFARDLARAHGGELSLQSSTVGAHFCLSLPLRAG